MKSVYGPVGSWRLGKALGVDVVNTSNLTCPYDCIFCRLGKGRHPTLRRMYIETGVVLDELREVLPKVEKDIDVILFSGIGEPTLAANLGEIVDGIKDLTKLPTAILTNCALLENEGVRRVLTNIDIVIGQMDAPDKETFEKINRPPEGFDFLDMLEGLQTFAEGYRGSFRIEARLIEENKGKAEELADLISSMEPEVIYLNIPSDGSDCKAITEDEMKGIRKIFEQRGDYRILDAYTTGKPSIEPLDKKQMKDPGRMLD